MGPIRVTPGFVSGSSAKGLNEVAAQSDKVRADMERMKVAMSGDFPAKLTAYDSITGFYSWTRQTFDDTMTRYDYDNAAAGTTTYNPARALNGEVLTTFPVNVWLRPVGTSATVGVVHEVTAGAASAGATFIQNVYELGDVALSPGWTTVPSLEIASLEVGVYLLTMQVGWKADLSGTDDYVQGKWLVTGGTITLYGTGGGTDAIYPHGYLYESNELHEWNPVTWLVVTSGPATVVWQAYTFTGTSVLDYAAASIFKM